MSRLSPTRVPVLVSALALAVASLVTTSCASASSASRERTSGLFDERYTSDDDGGGGYGGGGGSYARGAPGGYNEPMAVATAESAPEADGFFNFNGEDVAGELYAKKEAMPPGPPPPPPPPPPPQAGAPVNVATDAPPVEAPRQQRLVIYKGSVTVLVTNVEESTEKLAARAEALGGYVENQSSNSGANNATVTMRVPAEKLHGLVEELGTYGQVTQKQLSASDVTKQVFDTELRLETAEKSRQRLLDLLKTATKMEEILQIENEVRRLTQEIESMKGELRFLKDQVAFSTLAVTFYSNAPPPNPGPSRTRSRFDWINQVGIEAVLYQF
jgi:hypothetical protein